METMNQVNPPRTSSSRKQEKAGTTQVRQQVRQQVLQRLCNSVIDVLNRGEDAEADVESYLEAMRTGGQEMVASESKRMVAQASLDSANLREKNSSQLWKRRKSILASRKRGIPSRLFDSNGCLLSGPNIMGEIERAVKAMLTASDDHLLGPTDSSFDEVIAARHKILRRKAGIIHDWQPTEDDVDAVLSYFCKAYRKHTSPGFKQLTADMVVLGHTQMREAIRLVLCMLATCGKTPSHWGTIILIMALKPGRPAQNVENSYRPISLGELLMKGCESALKMHYHSALNAKPMHPSIMAYRKGIGTDIALFTLVGAVLSGQEQGKKLFILAIDIKCAFNGVWKQLLEVLEWDMHGNYHGNYLEASEIPIQKHTLPGPSARHAFEHH